MNEKNLLILDDCFLGAQNKAEAYYTRGRHNNCDTFYISQNYFRLSRQTIRENANFIVLFSQDAKNLMHIHADHCDDDMSLNEFKAFCREAWNSGKHNFVAAESAARGAWLTVSARALSRRFPRACSGPELGSVAGSR